MKRKIIIVPDNKFSYMRVAIQKKYAIIYLEE